jgi:cytidylate kinase
MPVITIRGQLGSGTKEIGQLVARKLNINYIDREIIAAVAQRLHSPTESIAHMEMPPSSLFGRIENALGKVSGDFNSYPTMNVAAFATSPDDAEYQEGLEAVIRDIAEGRSIVIRGRGSQFILKDFPGAFHVMLVAPLEMRVKRVMETLRLNEAKARKEISHFDKGRHQFGKKYFHADMEAPVYYDLVINTHHFSAEAAASIVVHAVALKQKSAGV